MSRHRPPSADQVRSGLLRKTLASGVLFAGAAYGAVQAKNPAVRALAGTLAGLSALSVAYNFPTDSRARKRLDAATARIAASAPRHEVADGGGNVSILQDAPAPDNMGRFGTF